MASASLAQTGAISGTISDENGAPLSSAQVVIREHLSVP